MQLPTPARSIFPPRPISLTLSPFALLVSRVLPWLRQRRVGWTRSQLSPGACCHGGGFLVLSLRPSTAFGVAAGCEGGCQSLIKITSPNYPSQHFAVLGTIRQADSFAVYYFWVVHPAVAPWGAQYNPPGRPSPPISPLPSLIAHSESSEFPTAHPGLWPHSPRPPMSLSHDP